MEQEEAAVEAIGFDVDGTIFKSFTAEMLPGTLEALKRLSSVEANHLFIATNQSGPVWRELLGQEKYAKRKQIASQLDAAVRWLAKTGEGRPVILLVATHPGKIVSGARRDWEEEAERFAAWLPDNLRSLGCPAEIIETSHNHEWRKPRPGMLLRAAELLKIPAGRITYIGDKDIDREAAGLAGTRFLEAERWRSDPQALSYR